MSGGLNGYNLMFSKRSYENHLKALKKDLNVKKDSWKSSVQNINKNTIKLDPKLDLAPEILNSKWTDLSLN
tara:strand:+ start:472 stop:684 length:213 start_codon:yes stop_codon:yes gene_type:complete